MAKNKKEKLAEEFLSSVTGVDTEAVLKEVRALKDEDIYTHFITKDALRTGKIEDVDMNEFLLKVCVCETAREGEKGKNVNYLQHVCYIELDVETLEMNMTRSLF